MSNFEVIKEWDTETGHVTYGVAQDEERKTEIPYWHGVPHDKSVEDYILAKTGLTADLQSLKMFGNTALNHGVSFVTVGHRHKNLGKAIKENSQDLQFILDNLVPEEVDVHGAGLSRGWAGILLAGIHRPDRFSSMTAIAPAMMAPVNPLRFWKIGAEVAVETAKNPREFGSVLVDSALTIKSRFGVTASEAIKVGIGGFVHKRIRDLRDSGPNVKLHLVASKEDCFFDPTIMERLADELAFDTFTLFCDGSAGHSALAYNDKLSSSVVATAIETLPGRDDYILGKELITSKSVVQ
jgi:hypothetical protein